MLFPCYVLLLCYLPSDSSLGFCIFKFSTISVSCQIFLILSPFIPYLFPNFYTTPTGFNFVMLSLIHTEGFSSCLMISLFNIFVMILHHSKIFIQFSFQLILAKILGYPDLSCKICTISGYIYYTVHLNEPLYLSGCACLKGGNIIFVFTR